MTILMMREESERMASGVDFGPQLTSGPILQSLAKAVGRLLQVITI